MKRISRTCTKIQEKLEVQQGEEQACSQGLKEFRAVPAYVLLGDPGAGKTTAFQDECGALGASAHFVTARDFLTLDPQQHPEWREKTLFIDGLDEIRAGTSDVRTPFDEIRRHLNKLKKPFFRLSCREADWLGENDRKRLELVSRDQRITVLRLDTLGDLDIEAFLKKHPGVRDAKGFIKSAGEKRIDGFLSNPQSLKMLADVVVDNGNWPKSRRELFETACEKMSKETNEEHRIAEPPSAPASEPTKLLDVAGRLCALLLISGKAGYVGNRGYVRHESADDYIEVEQCGGEDPALLHRALSTRLFRAESPSNGRFAPVHRHIAEYLGARYLAKLIDGTIDVRAPAHGRSTLPACRVLDRRDGQALTVLAPVVIDSTSGLTAPGGIASRTPIFGMVRLRTTRHQ